MDLNYPSNKVCCGFWLRATTRSVYRWRFSSYSKLLHVATAEYRLNVFNLTLQKCLPAYYKYVQWQMAHFQRNNRVGAVILNFASSFLYHCVSSPSSLISNGNIIVSRYIQTLIVSLTIDFSISAFYFKAVVPTEYFIIHIANANECAKR